MSDLEHGSTVGGSPIVTIQNANNHTHDSSQVGGLGTAATKDVGLSTGNVLEYGALGLALAGHNPLGTRDLNSVHDFSLYSQSANANAIVGNASQGGRNYPVASAGVLLVYRPSNLGETSAGIIQEYHEYLNGSIWKRGSSNGINWTPWNKELNTSHLSSSVSSTSTSTPANSYAVKQAYDKATSAFNSISGIGSGAIRYSLYDNGYVVFGNGFTIQWGRSSTPLSTANNRQNSRVIYFPLSFYDNATSVQISGSSQPSGTNVHREGTFTTSGHTKSQFTAWLIRTGDNGGGSWQSENFTWVAFGYSLP